MSWKDSFVSWIARTLGRDELLVDPSQERTVQYRNVPLVPSLDLSRATNLLGLLDSGELTTMELRAVYRGIVADLTRFRASTFAAALGQLSVQARRGEKWDEVPDDHPWNLILRRPNPDDDPVTFWEVAFSLYDLQGCASFYVERNVLGVPVVLHPVYPEYGTVKPNLNAVGAIESFTFRRADGYTDRWDRSEVLRIRRPHPLHKARDISLLQMAAFDVDVDTLGKISARDSAGTSQRPPVVLETDADLPPDKLDAVSQDFHARYTGRVRGTPVASSGLKTKHVALMEADLKLLEQRKYSKSEILRTWGIPEGFLSDKANRNNAEAHFFVFASYTVTPVMRSAAAQMEHQLEVLFSADPQALRIHVPNLVPTDLEVQTRLDVMRVNNGLASRNQILDRDGEDPIPGEGGNLFTVPRGLTTLDAVASGGSSFL